jgi:hypothetical protein
VKWLQDKVRDQLRHPEHPEGENLSKLCADLLGPGDMCPASDGPQKTIGSQDIEFETRLAWAKHLRLFRTRSGYLGLGSECVQEGDSVWIIPSSRVPLIFRPARKEGKGGNRWQLVGGTYLHGVMNGEMVCAYCSEKSQDEIESLWETIMIE